MKNFKKILVLALAVMMCLTALSIPAFAAFNPEVKITARFDETGEHIIASVVTTVKCGAIQGTLTYEGLTFDEESTKFTEISDQDKYVPEGNKVKFVLLANDLTNGDTHWADFYFDLPENMTDDTTFTFALENVAACDVNETLADAISVAPVSLTLTGNDLTTLGAQYREPTETVSSALRFGFRLDRKEGSNELSGNKVAVRCGYILSTKIDASTLLTADIREDGAVDVSTVTEGAKAYTATKCYKSHADYMIYTVAVKNIPDSVKDTKIYARPYVVYWDVTDEVYGIDFGTQVAKTYAEVQAASGLLDGNLGYGN